MMEVAIYELFPLATPGYPLPHPRPPLNMYAYIPMLLYHVPYLTLD